MSSKNHSLLGVATFVSTIMMTACVLYPHKETLFPEINVSLTKNGLPVSGAEVYLSESVLFFPKQICRSPIFVGSTKQNGSVLIQARKEWSFFYDFLNDFSKSGKYEMRRIDLCFKINGQYVYGDFISSRLDIIEHFNESCSLNNYPNVIFGEKNKIYQSSVSDLRICRAK